jgi:hypothetical protein
MWYVAHLLFAQKPKKGKRRALCESCEILLRTSSALKCYNRALVWAKRHEQEGTFNFVGVQHIKPLDDERPDDGSEIGGDFFDAYDVWQRVKTLIPRKDEIPIVRLETHKNTPIGKLMTPKQKRIGRQIFRR